MQLHEKHPTVNFLVYEEPEIDTEENPIIIWKAVKFTIADINLEVTALQIQNGPYNKKLCQNVIS